jgi:hypothetical protein
VADTEGWNVITNGATQLVGTLAFQTGVASTGPAVGNPIFASINGIRSDGTTVSQTHPFPVADANAETALTTIAGNTNGVATLAGQTTGNAALATIATAQGNAATGVAQPAGGLGVLGFLSGIYAKIISTLTISGTVTSNDGGTPANGIAQPTGGIGISGWLSGIYNAAINTQPVRIVENAVALDVTVTAAAGAAVNILTAGHAINGGFVIPASAGWINQITNANTGVASSDIPVGAGQTYLLRRSSAAVSFISNTATVTLVGNGAT